MWKANALMHCGTMYTRGIYSTPRREHRFLALMEM